ncbi:MAG: hypothetical protein PHU66_11345 [Bacteroidaceae bacterium]|nr:hypothetical protein [Bacteroidaceae bacterium]
MSLTNFFKVNLPYGLKKNSNNEWMAFNREYVPIGWSKETPKESLMDKDAYNTYPIHATYKGLTDNKIEKIIKEENCIERNEKNEIVTIYFYSDKTNPQSSNHYWNDYFAIIKELSKLETVENPNR